MGVARLLALVVAVAACTTGTLPGQPLASGEIDGRGWSTTVTVDQSVCIHAGTQPWSGAGSYCFDGDLSTWRIRLFGERSAAGVTVVMGVTTSEAVKVVLEAGGVQRDISTVAITGRPDLAAFAAGYPEGDHVDLAIALDAAGDEVDRVYSPARP